MTGLDLLDANYDRMIHCATLWFTRDELRRMTRVNVQNSEHPPFSPSNQLYAVLPGSGCVVLMSLAAQ